MVTFRPLGAVLLVLALGVPAFATEEASRTPLLDALAFVPRQHQQAGLDFVDWAQLKALRLGAERDAPTDMSERQRLLLEIARSEAAPMPFGFDRLPRWTEAWGWDSLDLEWEARVYGELAVMHFDEHWDPRRFREALLGFGYRPEPFPGGTVYDPDPTAEVPWYLRFANMHALDVHGRVTTQPMVQLAISADGRTVLFSRAHRAGPWLRAGLEADPAEVAATGFGRAAAALGRPVAASLLDGRTACTERTNGWLEGEARRVAASVAPLHRYQALAAGYTRSDATGSPDGHFVFVYDRPEQARDDLAGRRLLIEQGYQYDDDISRYEDVAFSLSDARVTGSELVLDVAPVGGAPVHVLRNVQIKPALFATCGPIPSVVA